MAYTQQLLNSLRKTAPSSASENAHQLLTSSTSSNWAASRMRFESTPSLASRREYHSENSDLHAILESQNEKISRLMNRNDALEMQIAEHREQSLRQSLHSDETQPRLRMNAPTFSPSISDSNRGSVESLRTQMEELAKQLRRVNSENNALRDRLEQIEQVSTLADSIRRERDRLNMEKATLENALEEARLAMEETRQSSEREKAELAFRLGRDAALSAITGRSASNENTLSSVGSNVDLDSTYPQSYPRSPFRKTESGFPKSPIHPLSPFNAHKSASAGTGIVPSEESELKATSPRSERGVSSSPPRGNSLNRESNLSSYLALDKTTDSVSNFPASPLLTSPPKPRRSLTMDLSEPPFSSSTRSGELLLSSTYNNPVLPSISGGDGFGPLLGSPNPNSTNALLAKHEHLRKQELTLLSLKQKNAQSNMLNGMGMGPMGMTNMGMMGMNGMVGMNGMGMNGMNMSGMGFNGMGMNMSGMGPNSLGMSGMGMNGMGMSGMGMNGMGNMGMTMGNMGMNGTMGMGNMNNFNSSYGGQNGYPSNNNRGNFDNHHASNVYPNSPQSVPPNPSSDIHQLSSPTSGPNPNSPQNILGTIPVTHYSIGPTGQFFISGAALLPFGREGIVMEESPLIPHGGWTVYQHPPEGVEWPKTMAFFAPLVDPGIPFVKHGRYGRPHRRILWLDISDPNTPCLVFNDGDTKNPSRVKEKNRIRLIDILDIRMGRVSPVLMRSGNDNDAEKYICFTTETRTLDLEAPTPEGKDFLFRKFSDLFHAYATAQMEKLNGDAITMRVAGIIDGGVSPKPGALNAPPPPPPQKTHPPHPMPEPIGPMYMNGGSMGGSMGGPMVGPGPNFGGPMHPGMMRY